MIEILSRRKERNKETKEGKEVFFGMTWVKLVINYFINLEKLCIKSLIKKLGIALRIDGFFFSSRPH